MYSYKLFLFVLTAIIMIGCSTVSSDNSTFLSNDVYIKYVNKKGENLLNPAHSHAITEQNTNLYYLINGKKKRVYRPNLDAPKMFVIGNGFDSSGDYEMKLFANTPPDQMTAITYINFKNFPTDTLKVQYESPNSSIAITKVWYNGELRLDLTKRHKGQVSQRVIVVTKHLSAK